MKVPDIRPWAWPRSLSKRCYPFGAVVVGTSLLLSGCVDLSGWDAMYESEPTGDTAISMAESGQLTVHMMACEIEVESVEISVATDVPGGVPKAERFFFDGPQSGYVELALPESMTGGSELLSDIFADPELPFWVTPITFEGESEEPRFVPPLNGVTVSEIRAFPVDSLLVEHYQAGSHGPTPLEEVSREQFAGGQLTGCGAS